MPDIFKNKMLYYFAVPVVFAIWAGYNSLIALPNSQQNYREAVSQYEQSQPLIEQIITLAPEKVISSNEIGTEFDYDQAIMKTAQVCRISPSKITPSIRAKISNNRQEIRDAIVSIAEIKISQFASFLSVSLHLYPNLQCERLKLTRLKGEKDLWKADINYRYFY